MNRRIARVVVLVSLQLVAAGAAARDAGTSLPVDGGAPARATSPVAAASDGGIASASPWLPTLNGSWTGDVELGGGSYGEIYADGAVTWKGWVWLFGTGVGDHKIYYNKLPPGGGAWTGWYAVQPNADIDARTQVTPFVYQDKLYVFFVHYPTSRISYKWTADGSTWSTRLTVDPYRLTTKPVTVAEYYGRLYVFSVQGSPLRHYYNAFNGATWTLPRVEVGGGGTTLQGSSATVYQGKLWLFGLGTDGSHWYNTFDGYLPWSGWTAVPGGAVGEIYPDKAIVYNNRLHLFDQGGGKRVFVFKIDGAEAYPVDWWDVSTDHEPEGIFLWDFGIRTDLPRFTTAGGQLHVLIRDNNFQAPDHGNLQSFSVPHWQY